MSPAELATECDRAEAEGLDGILVVIPGTYWGRKRIKLDEGLYATNRGHGKRGGGPGECDECHGWILVADARKYLRNLEV